MPFGARTSEDILYLVRSKFLIVPKMVSSRVATVCSVFCLVSALAATARGDGGGAAQKAAGDAAMDSLQYADALRAYERAYAELKDPAILYNMGRALEALARFPEALDKLDQFDRDASPELKARVPGLAKRRADLARRVTTLTITSNVDGARVIVRGAIVGKTPLAAPLRLPSGDAEVQLELDGYFPFSSRVQLAGGASLTITGKLQSKATTGILAVRASAPGATVSIDGKVEGSAPVERFVSAGAHRVGLTHPDYRDYDTSAIVAVGERKEVIAELQSPSVFSRWWFWTGAAVAVAGGVAVAIVATTERSPDTGTIPPGQLPTSRRPSIDLRTPLFTIYRF